MLIRRQQTNETNIEIVCSMMKRRNKTFLTKEHNNNNNREKNKLEESDLCFISSPRGMHVSKFNLIERERNIHVKSAIKFVIWCRL